MDLWLNRLDLRFKKMLHAAEQSRTDGRSPVGQRLVCAVPHYHYQTTLIAAGALPATPVGCASAAATSFLCRLCAFLWPISLGRRGGSESSPRL